MDSKRVLCLLKNEGGEALGAPMDLPIDVTKANLENLMQTINNNEVCS
jgi:hypothetical protein